MTRVPGWLLALLLTLGVACGGGGGETSGSAPRGEAPTTQSRLAASAASAPASPELPPRMAPCGRCHYTIVTSYLGHGMARSLGPLGEPPVGEVARPGDGTRYELSSEGGAGWLTAKLPGGGERRQRLVGRIGAGIFDTSWVGAEVDVVSGESTGRLFFAPVESVTGRGLELSPFELSARPAGLDLALTEGCLTCHTTDRLERLPGAATPAGMGGPPGRPVFPANDLGAGAFEQLSPIGCEGCHGDAGRHLEAVARLAEGQDSDEIGLRRLGKLPAANQRDVCARCHLQGEARIDLVAGEASPERPLAGQIAVLVPAAPDRDFRFVGQLERLVLSACFRGSPEMTCTTCHRPHAGVAAQGVASFEAACVACHEVCSRDPALAVAEVTGEPARGAAGCVDCHVRRSQPFDLPHVRSADHFVRRRIELPEDDLPHRQFADPDGLPVLFDDGRLGEALATPAGRRWRDGVLALGLASMGRLEEATRRFDGFPPPGTPAARRPPVSEGESAAAPLLVPLETDASFHQTRALALLASGRFDEAKAAFTDALQVDPMAVAARLGRAQVRFDTGDVAGALEDTQWVIDLFPRAEHPWALRARMAERLGRPDLALRAFEAYTRTWPSNAVVWYKLGLLLRQSGDAGRAEAALARARRLSPSPPAGLAPRASE